MKHISFTEKEISLAIVKLVEKISRISIFIEILDKYFDNFLINHRTMPLVMVLSELTFHMYGQMTRICFDVSKDHKTASVREIYNQITKAAAIQLPKGNNHKDKFDKSKADIISMEDNYEMRMKQFTDKHYAHLEIRTPEQEKQDYDELRMGWNDFKGLVAQAKKILYVIHLFWDNSDTDFAGAQYDSFKNGFWKLINLPHDTKSPDDWI